MVDEPEATLLKYARKEPPQQFKCRLFELLCTGFLLAVPVYFFWWFLLLEVGFLVHTGAVLAKSPIPQSTTFIVYGLSYRGCALHIAAITGMMFVFLSLKQDTLAYRIANVVGGVLSVAILLMICLWLWKLSSIEIYHQLVLWASLGSWGTALLFCILYCRFRIRVIPILFVIIPPVSVMAIARIFTWMSIYEDMGKWTEPLLMKSVLAMFVFGLMIGLLLLVNKRMKTPFCPDTVIWLIGAGSLALSQFWFDRILAPLTYGVDWLGLSDHHEWNWLLHALFVAVEIGISYRIWCVFRDRDGGSNFSASSSS